jgi:hypothetical protein
MSRLIPREVCDRQVTSDLAVGRTVAGSALVAHLRRLTETLPALLRVLQSDYGVDASRLTTIRLN